MPERLIDFPLEDLPEIDEHSLEIAASPDVVWQALLDTLTAFGDRRTSPRIARRLGCFASENSGKPGRVGSTFTGFVVARSIRPAVLALMGQHRFSRYALVFTIVPKPSGLTVLTAQTRAEFSGRAGRAYRRAVIGTRGHVAVTTGLLRNVRRVAERRRARPPA